MISRRPLLKLLGGSAAALSAQSVFSALTESNYQIGACDWCLKKKQDIAAFEVAKAIGLEGIQVSFSTPGSEFDLRNRKVRDAYYKRVDETGIQMASLGMGILNQRPLASDPEAIGWVSDAVDTMAAMKAEQPDKAPSVCLLAFFGIGDINGKPDAMDSVIKKLKTVAKKAEDNGVVLGLESYLSADDHLQIIDGVGSKAIQVYYDSANSAAMGYDIYEEAIQLGGERICEVHCKEKKTLLGGGDIDFPKFAAALKKAGYDDGWLIIEGALPKGTDLVESYKTNFSVLNKSFRGA